VDEMFGHGGLFKTKGVGQRIAAAAMNTSVSVMETAGEGGPWGMALLAAYMQTKEENESLENFLKNKIATYCPFFLLYCQKKGRTGS